MRQRKTIESGPHTVVCQKWEESERGWGTRPDGFSLHLTDEERRQFIAQYWDRMPETAPDEYTKPDGTPYLVDVGKGVFEAIMDSEHGVRYYDHHYDYPGDGGTDGWIPNR